MEQEIEKPKIEENIKDVNSMPDEEVGESENQKEEAEEVNKNQEEQAEEVQASESTQDSNDLKDNNKNKEINKMRLIEIEKIVLHCGGTEDKLEKSVKLLEKITNKENKVYIVKSTRRIPAFGISPGKQSGCKVTIRNKEKIKNLLERFFSALDNKISKKQVVENQICFGVHEYIEVPGLEYDRDIGISGFEVDVVFKRKGKRVKMRKIRRGNLPKKQQVTKEEIIEYLIKNFDLEVEEK